MKLHYYPETDRLYIELANVPGTEAREMPRAWLSISIALPGSSICPRSRP